MYKDKTLRFISLSQANRHSAHPEATPITMRNHWTTWGLLLLLASLAGCSEPFSRKSRQPLPPLETTHFKSKVDNSVVGHIYRLQLQKGDTLADVARHFAIGFQALQDANPGIDPWLPPEGKEIILPLAFILPDAPREGLVINLPSMRLFHFKEHGRVESYPIGIGRAGWNTPLGRTHIVQKKSNPKWVVPESIRREHASLGDPLPKVVPSGPDNPLGSHALRLGFPSYLIHGTNKPYGVGLRISHGCIRLYPENMVNLYSRVEVGTPVTIVDQPYLLGWWGNQLYLEAHTPLQPQGEETVKWLAELEGRLRRIEKEIHGEIDWNRVAETVSEARGIPIPILTKARNLDRLIASVPLAPHPDQWPYSPDFPDFSVGWYLDLDLPLMTRDARKLAAILRHQGPPLPAHRIGDQVFIGPYASKPAAIKIKSRLQRKLQLGSKLVSPWKSQELLKMTVIHYRE